MHSDHGLPCGLSVSSVGRERTVAGLQPLRVVDLPLGVGGCAGEPGGCFLGGSSAALRIASRDVVASHQSVLPARRAIQAQLQALARLSPRISWRPTSTGPRGVETVTITERFRTALPAISAPEAYSGST